MGGSTRHAVLLAMLAATTPAAAQEADEPAAERRATRVAVLSAEGNCHAALKRELTSSALATVGTLDQDTFETVAPDRLSAEQMGLGEKPCSTEKCWLELAGKLGIPFLLRTECLKVGGTAYATTRFFNAKSRVIKSSQSMQAESVKDVRLGAPNLYRVTVEEALGVSPRVASGEPQKPNPLLQRRVAVIVCEKPDGARAFVPDRGRTGVTSPLVVDWLQRTDHQVLDAPPGFDPGGSAGCELESARSGRLATATSASVVVWLRASDVRVNMSDQSAIHTEFTVALEGRAYSTALGRHGPRFEAQGTATCKQPVLKARDCRERLLKELVAEVMARWDETLALPADKF